MPSFNSHMPEPWIDGDGQVHRPLFRDDARQGRISATPLKDVLNEIEDPGAYLVLERNNRYCDDFWTLRYYNDQSDYYAI